MPSVTPRHKKFVGISPHVFEQAKDRNLYKSIKNARDDIINAVKKLGVLLPQPEENKFLCVFKNNENGKCCTCPVLETDRAFMVITIWESSGWEKSRYKLERTEIPNSKGHGR